MSKPKAGKNRYISYIFRFAVAAAALYLAFRKEDLGGVVKVISGLNLWIFAASLALYVIAQLIFALRWSLLLWVQSIKIGYWPAVRLHFLGLFYNNCLPTSVGGDLLRAWYVTRHTDKKLEAVLSVFVDRVVGLTGMLLMVFFFYWFIPVDGQRQRFEFSYRFNFLQRLNDYRWFLVGIVAAFAIVIIVFISSGKGRDLLCRSYRFVYGNAVVVLRRSRMAVRIYYSKMWVVICAMLLTFCLQGLCIVAMWLIGREIGVTAHIKYYFIFFPLSWLLGMLPISVGGLGITEGGLKVMFVRLCGVSGKHALVLALGQRLIWLFGSLPGAVVHLVGAHLPKDFFIDYNESVS